MPVPPNIVLVALFDVGVEAEPNGDVDVACELPVANGDAALDVVLLPPNTVNIDYRLDIKTLLIILS